VDIKNRIWTLMVLLLWPVLIVPYINADNNATVSATAVFIAEAPIMLHGRVLELGTSDPVEGARVEIKGATLSAETDAKGYYDIGPVPKKAELMFSAEGYSDAVLNADKAKKDGLMPDVRIKFVNYVSDAVIITAKREKGEAITTTLSRDEIKKMPGTAGDAVRAVQNLPGVQAPNDFLSQLVVQGGGPSDNLYLIDGIPWPFPFHFGGILSTINSDILSTVDLNSAGFGARWGNVLGSVLCAKTRHGKDDRLHYTADVSLITSQGLIEGPLGLGDAVFTLSGRRSYMDLIFGKTIKGFTALPNFWDAGLTLDFTLSPDNRFHGLMLANEDALDLNTDGFKASGLNSYYKGRSVMDNSSFTGGFNWINTSIPNFISTMTPYYYYTYMMDIVGSALSMDLKNSVLGIREEAEYGAGEFLGLKHNIGFGGEVQLAGERMDCDIYENLLNKQSTDYIKAYVSAWNINSGLYIQDRARVMDPMEITAGLRYDRNGNTGIDRFSPRLGFEWDFDADTKCRMAWGDYSQFPDALQTDKNIGNDGLKPNLAEHLVISFEKRFAPELTARVSAYYKTYDDLVINTQNNELYANAETGIAKGVEMYLRGEFDSRFSAWVSYAFSRSERYGPPVYKWVLYEYDEPQNMTLAANYRITTAWNAGIKLSYHSGPLKKRLLESYKNSLYIADSPYTDTDESRLAYYCRLDIRTEYSWLFESWTLKAYLEVLNTLNRANPQGLYYPNGTSNEPVVLYNMPIVPYFGVSAEF
jgi:hypothetical protein